MNNEKTYYNLSFKQVASFCNISVDHRLRSLDFIKSKYEDRFYNFDNLIVFLNKARLLSIKNKKITINIKFKKFLDSWKQNKSDKELSTFFAGIIINHPLIKEDVYDYLSKFEYVNNRLEYNPSSRQRLENGLLRNFLIDFHVINLSRDKRKYYTHFDSTTLLRSKCGRLKLNYNQFKNILLQREKIGLVVEKIILRYEKERLKEHPLLVKKIVHMARENVNAGFDILSYENIRTKEQKRYIEVKAVSPIDYQFYISRNELENAKEKGKQYYLYLLPVLKMENFDLENLIIINNPYKKIFNKHDGWEHECELYSIKKSVPKGIIGV